MNKRAVGVIIKDDKVLLMKRVKNGLTRFVFPGGNVEKGETLEQAAIREIKEELSLDVKIDKLIFEYLNKFIDQEDGKEYCSEGYYFLITEFSGSPKMGDGPEKERMSEQNRYIPVWKTFEEIKNLKNLYPEEAKNKILKIFSKSGNCKE